MLFNKYIPHKIIYIVDRYAFKLALIRQRTILTSLAPPCSDADEESFFFKKSFLKLDFKCLIFISGAI